MNQSVLDDYLASLEGHGIPGCDCVIYKDHKQIFRKTYGYADSGKTKPLTDANTYFLYSASKLITCTAALQLVEKGVLSLDDKVFDYLPEYKNLKVKNGAVVEQAKNAMTIRRLFSMQSGLDYNTQAPSILKIAENARLQATTRANYRSAFK